MKYLLPSRCYFNYLVIIQILSFCLYSLSSYSQNDLSVLSKWQTHQSSSNVLYEYLTEQSFPYLEKRNKEIKQINTLSEWKTRQKTAKSKLVSAVGQFPERSPLNPIITKTIQKNGFRIEHILLESQPNFYVTSTLYLPDGNGKKPAILFCSGHSALGYREGAYQNMILNLVKKGFIVYAFDPVGQGERLNYYDQIKNESVVGGPTQEHFYPGVQSFISGKSLANLMIWDGIRCIDYLVSRHEVDPQRIGITGRSGGGTQSAYIAAFDERILAAAPEAYITNFTRLLQSIGPQDAEQHFYKQISLGLDHADFLEVRAPKPALMITTINDMFSIQGAKETEQEVAKIYKAYGKSDHFNRAEDFGGHQSTKNNREAMYAFFQKHLSLPGNASDETILLLKPEELQVTTTGQLASTLKSETVFSLNQKYVYQKISNLEKSRRDISKHLSSIILDAKKVSGYQEPRLPDLPQLMASYQNENYILEKYIIKGEGNYQIPYLLFIPNNANQKPMLYLHEDGKTAAVESKELLKYLEKGYTIMVPDLVGVGELGPGDWSKENYFQHKPNLGLSYPIWMAALSIGRSIAGIRASDVVKLANILKNQSQAEIIKAVAIGRMTTVLIHAAAFDKVISDITLIKPLVSFKSMVSERFYSPTLVENSVPSALNAYDLPDLAASLAPRKLSIVQPVDANLESITQDDMEKEYAIIIASYKFQKADGNLSIILK